MSKGWVYRESLYGKYYDESTHYPVYEVFRENDDACYTFHVMDEEEAEKLVDMMNRLDRYELGEM